MESGRRLPVPELQDRLKPGGLGKFGREGRIQGSLPTTWEETRTLAPVGLLATDSKEAEGTVVHTLAILADTFPADEQEEPLLAGGAAVLLRADDTARAVSPQTSACCSQTGARKTVKSHM